MPTQSFINCRFYVRINKDWQAVFTEVSGLQMETEVYEWAEGGLNSFVHRLPGRSKIGNLVLKRGITKSNELFKWCRDVVDGKIVKRHVTVAMFDTEGTEVAKWNFDNAYPVKWSGPQFQADGQQTAIETLELAHDGLGTD